MLNKLKQLRNTNEEGFTLIELLVVIVIIGILAAIALPIFLNQQKAAIDASIKSDMKTIALAQQTYITKNPSSAGTSLPAELNKLVPQLSDGNIIGTWVANGKGFCIAGMNPNGNADGGTTSAAGNYFWYDSALGGWAKNAVTGTPPAGGACAVDPRPQSVWFDATTPASSGWRY